MPLTAAQVADHLQGDVLGDPSTVLTGFAPTATARPGDLTFAENEIYFRKADQSAASAVLVDNAYSEAQKVLIRVRNARVGFAKVLPLFFPERAFAPGIHPTALVAATACIDATAHIGPYSVVGDGVRIGARSVLEGANHIGDGCQIGDDARLFPQTVLYPGTQLGHRVRIHSGSVVGADGFGYVLDGQLHRKIPQVGCVILQDDVELGANVTIDRGALGPTVIGKGTKIDNLVQVAHNVTIGEHCLLVSQCGIAGSTRLGNYVTLAGQVGVAGHLKIGDRVVVAAQSGVMTDIPTGGKWLGSPARPDRQTKRQWVALEDLPELLRRVSDLERKFAALSPPPPDQDQSVDPS